MTTVLVTGASGGIGAAVSKALAARGTTVILHYQSNAGSAREVLQSLPNSGHALVQADLNEPAAIRRLWDETADRHIDVVINNAGVFPKHPPLATTAEDWASAWQHTLSVNLSGPALLTYFAARTMAADRGGRIVNISSRGAFRGEPDMPAYAASKAGLNAFTQSMAKALAPHAVYLFGVAPGWVSTPNVAEFTRRPEVLADQPLGRVATPAEVAQVITYCALDAPPSLTGAILDVNGASYLR